VIRLVELMHGLDFRAALASIGGQEEAGGKRL
jgi:hypothetical protein